MNKTLRDGLITGILVAVLLVLVWKNLFQKPANETPKTSEDPTEVVDDMPEGIAATNVGADASVLAQEQVALLGPLNTEALAAQQESLQRDWGRDPFYTTQGRVTSSRGALILRGISWRQENGMAVINDQIMQEGDMIEDSTVKSIEKNKVILERDGREFYLILEEEHITP